MTRARLWPLGLCALVGACEPDEVVEVRPVLVVDDQTLDFGAVPEGSAATLGARLRNPVGVPVQDFELTLEAGTSADFSIETSSTSIGPGQVLEVQVTFRPEGPGTDEGAILVTSDFLADSPARIPLRGGPIAPCIEVRPDPIDFGPASSATVARTFEVVNDCQSNLHITAAGAAPDGNPDFTVRPWSLPVVVAPGGRHAGAIDYVRSGRATAGRLVVESDAPDMSPLEVRLLPDPYRACEDGEDNDGDGLVDFPDDPGCAEATDDDESNPPECEDGATEICGEDTGECELGMRTCRNRLWGPCEGAVGPVPESCDGLDNDCDTRVDEEVTGTCTIHGCAGARLCLEGAGVPGGQWSDCIPASPEAEMCDGLDNDCNGLVDDGIVEACNVFMCMGTRICVPEGTGEFTACQVNARSEVCNGLDDDCNGVPDDGLPVLTCGLGVCTATAAACVNGQPGMCTPGPSRNEACNGLDDDCDGTPDNLPDLTCGVGQCMRTVPACVGTAPNTCVPGMAVPEICNGLDDDCDGTPDNGVCTAPTCGPSLTTADAYEPNNAFGSANPQVVPVLGSRTFTYDITLTPGDEDWMQFNFPAPGSASIASISAQLTCVSWATATGCPTPPTAGLAAWYFDDVCSPTGQQDGFNSGTSGLPFVSSSGSVSPFGICVPQRFRIRAFPSSTICAGEAINAELQVTVSFQ